MYKELDDVDRRLIEAAGEALNKNYLDGRNTVAAAVLTAGGRVFVGMSVEGSGFGACAETVAMGAAISAGEREYRRFAAVTFGKHGLLVLSPCGNCRQMILDYAPRAEAAVTKDGQAVRAAVTDLLPAPYAMGDGR